MAPRGGSCSTRSSPPPRTTRRASGPGGYYVRSFSVPYRVTDDGALNLDTDVLAGACDGLAWSDIDIADPATDEEKLIASFACDWFRGVSLGSAIRRARRICPGVPKREPDEETDDYELRVSNVEYESPAICHVADRFLAIAKTKPPYLLPPRASPKTQQTERDQVRRGTKATP